ncbi:MAG TPA: tetratricopeptide repeat protein [Candidatus Krumholzibacteria bacterium]|jgi:tetratricopeptide (TPR) repeat protein
MRRRAADHLVLLLLCLAAYWGVWNFGFVSYDDPDYLSQNPIVQQGLTASGLRWAWTTSHAANWHPLTWVSLQTQVNLFGAGSGSAHAVNLLLHVLASSLLLELLLMFGFMAAPSLLLAAIFALHPAHVESVAWIAERKDVLSAVLGLSSLCAWLRFGQQGKWRDYLWCFVFLGFGLLAKQMLVSWPLIFLLLNRWPLNRALSLRRQLLEVAPMVIISVAAGLATVWAQSAGGAVVSGYDLTLLPRLGNASISLWRYVGILVWPVDLSFLYPHPDLTPALGGTPVWKVCAAVAALVALLVGARRLPIAVRVGLAFYGITLLPALGILQVGPQSHADRYSYLPSIGLLIALGWVLRGDRTLHRIVGGAAVLLCLVGTRQQLGVWRDDDALYGHALGVNPDNWLAASNYAKLLSGRGEIAKAERLYQNALVQRPQDSTTHYNLGTLLMQSGRTQEAEAELKAAIDYEPTHVDALNNLSQIYADRGDHARAAALLERAHAAFPRQADVEVNLADSLRRLGRTAEAAGHLGQVLRRHPCHRRALDVSARLHFAEDPDGALGFARRALECGGGEDPVILETLARIQHRLGDLAAARATAERALELAARLGQSARAERLESFLAQLEAATP